MRVIGVNAVMRVPAVGARCVLAKAAHAPQCSTSGPGLRWHTAPQFSPAPHAQAHWSAGHRVRRTCAGCGPTSEFDTPGLFAISRILENTTSVQTVNMKSQLDRLDARHLFRPPRVHVGSKIRGRSRDPTDSLRHTSSPGAADADADHASGGIRVARGGAQG